MLYIDYDGRVWIANCASAEYYKKEWKKFSEKTIGPWPHEAWYDKHTIEGWPLPKDYENCNQHLAFLDQVDKLEKEETWSGLVFIKDSRVIDSKVKILPGTTIVMHEGANLIFKNYVEAIGNPDSKISFISRRNRGTWFQQIK